MFGRASEEISDPTGDFKAFMRLALRSPEGFGFFNQEDAAGASLGHAYEIWSIDNWNSVHRGEHADMTDEVVQEGAIGKIYEVLGVDGGIRCSFVYSRDSSGYFIPVSLSVRDAELLKQIVEHSAKNHLVIIDDVKSKRFSDRRSPDVIMDFSGGAGEKPEVPIGILPSDNPL